ncbi:MAG: phosphoribosylformylglycinamidine cyclo-ligase [Clostridiales bacterium]|jgi:phosphoribosylformylglycinamidine cyclo-ligase|nr:phosphoribosylformylglycinamidine cyclo-ligase [Clostridiales bacterium]
MDKSNEKSDTVITYGKSGVDIGTADAAKKKMAGYIDGGNPRVLNKTGAFASVYDIKFPKMKNPVLVLKTEEPGSKQKLAVEYNVVENVCYDMINHLTNDILVMGATPLTVQDAIICGKIEPDIVDRIVKTVAKACKENGSVLTGGETSEQPNVVEKGTYILTSSIVGIAEKDEIIDGSKIKEGDTVLALASNGVHTNGYSFLRMLMKERPGITEALVGGERFIDVILKPHKSYYKELIWLFKNPNLKGMAHITGGGIKGNLNRILPDGLSAEIDLFKIRPLPIFSFIKETTRTPDEELLKTFNMGVGMTIVVSPGAEKFFIDRMKTFGTDCYEIGKIIKGDKTVKFTGKLM